ncbi:MAG TPA: gephyrin-like molybdotransferase Glp [Gemmatimonadaceae bacterium]|nr:gephyrin-like molybdotransferase Glp [Gemmatimonadaceae bacterium]
MARLRNDQSTLKIADASERILAEIKPLEIEKVPLRQALGRVLAEDISATVTMPPWSNSSMDGYAVRSADITPVMTGQKVKLRVVGTIAAGDFAKRPIKRGEAMRIMTGAPIPDGADSVIRKEDTDGGAEKVEIREARDVWKNIRPAGEDFQRGDLLAKRGYPLKPALLGVLASTGVREVKTFRRPRVAIISSGDELVDIDDFDQVSEGRRIVSTNSYTLDAMTRVAGGKPVDLGIAADTKASLRRKLDSAEGCDLILTSAGVSVGDMDHTRDVFEELGGELKFWKVKMRPGAPLAFGLLDGVPWIGVSGNPVSAMVSFELFVRPALRKMQGHAALFRRTVTVTVEEEIRIAVKLTHFLRAIVSRAPDGSLSARLTGIQSSGALTSMAKANALLIVPETSATVAKGSQLNALMLDQSLEETSAFAL